MTQRTTSRLMSTNRADGEFGPHVLRIDSSDAVGRIARALSQQVARVLRRRGVVVAVSGGVDSAVCLALAVQALSAERVFGLLMPERDSPPEGSMRARALCEKLGVDYQLEDISLALEALGAYRRRDEAIRSLVPLYRPGYRSKIAVADKLTERDRVNYFNLIVESPDGLRQKKRLSLSQYLQLVAATNMKQRTRKLLEYYHAARRHFAVLGTPNRLEFQLGFFVRGGDGLADVKPIAHLYKTQVYALAHYLEVPQEICDQPPCTDTYSLPQTQEEFYFGLPHEQMDLLLYAFLHDVPAGEADRAVGLRKEQVERVYRDIAAKRRVAAQLNRAAMLVEDVVVDSELDQRCDEAEGG